MSDEDFFLLTDMEILQRMGAYSEIYITFMDHFNVEREYRMEVDTLDLANNLESPSQTPVNNNQSEQQGALIILFFLFFCFFAFLHYLCCMYFFSPMQNS